MWITLINSLSYSQSLINNSIKKLSYSTTYPQILWNINRIVNNSGELLGKFVYNHNSEEKETYIINQIIVLIVINSQMAE